MSICLKQPQSTQHQNKTWDIPTQHVNGPEFQWFQCMCKPFYTRLFVCSIKASCCDQWVTCCQRAPCQLPKWNCLCHLALPQSCGASHRENTQRPLRHLTFENRHLWTCCALNNPWTTSKSKKTSSSGHLESEKILKHISKATEKQLLSESESNSSNLRCQT